MAAAAPTTSPAPPSSTATAPEARTMIYRRLGNTGLKVSVLSFGSWVSFDYQLGVPQAKEMIQTCYDAGVNFFDNAEVYAHGKSELIMGQAFKELDISRENVVISTKIFFGATPQPAPTARGLSRKHIIEGLRASLLRLGMPYVDIVFAHRPDPETPMEETVRAFNWVIDQGWAHYWGTSEWSASQIMEANAIAERLHLVGPAAEQPQYNMLVRKRVEVEYEALYESRHGLGLTIWSPLASGLLSGKYSGGAVPEGSRFKLERYKFLADNYLTEEKIAAADALAPIAAELGCTPAQLALAWCASNPHVSTVLTGASKMEQVHQNLGALQVLPKLTEEVLARINDVMEEVNDLEDED